MAADLDTLITSDVPEGRQNLLDSFTNLEKVAEYCENNYFQSENKRAALEETKGYTTQSLASVAYQINTLAYNFLQMLDLQSSQLSEMESQVNHIVQTVAIHKEKVARREIGILTTNKSLNRQYKIIAPANPERPVKYVRKPIDYSILDDIGHGVRVAQHHVHFQQQPGQPQQRRPSSSSSPYGSVGPSMGMVGTSQYAPGGMSGPAPTTKPPTPPQAARYSSSGGTLSRSSKEYRTPPAVNPPQVPSNYAPNYPRKTYGTLPHSHQSNPQVGMVHPVQQPLGSGGGGDALDNIRTGGTMPRLSSSSMRSNASSSGSGADSRVQTLGRISGNLGFMRQNTPPGSIGGGSVQSGTSPSQYGQMMRPSQGPPSPPLPTPPMATQDPQQIYAQRQAQQLQQQIYSSRQQQQQQEVAANAIYSRQLSTASSIASEAASMAQYGQLRQHHPQMMRQNSVPQSQGIPQGPPMGMMGQENKMPVWVPKNYLERVTAIYDYSADKDDELSFAEGATIYVVKKNDDGWWEGVMNGITGLFPGNYVEASL